MENIRENTFCKFISPQKLRINKRGNLAFITVQPDESKNVYVRELCLYERGTVRKNVASFVFLHDFVWLNDTTILLDAVRGEDHIKCVDDGVPFSILYTLDIRSGTVKEYARMPYKIVAFKAVGDGRLAMSLLIDPEAKSLYERLGENLLSYADAYRRARDCFVASEIPFCMEGEGFSGNKRTVLGIFQNGALLELTSSKETVCDFDVYEDKVLVFIVKEFDSVRQDESTIGCYNLETGEMMQWPEQIPKFYASIRAVDESRYAAACTDGKLHGIYQDFSIEICDIATNNKLFLNADAELSLFCSMNTDIYMSSGQHREFCSKEDSLYFVSTVHDSSHVFRADYKEKKIQQVTRKKGLVKEIAAFKNEFYFVGARDRSGFELYKLNTNTGVEKQLTFFNKTNDVLLWSSQPEEVSFHNTDGHKIFGWVMKPRGFTSCKKYPAILSIHGGPNMAYGPNYIHELQFMASSGYGVFFCNPRGSVGRGGPFMDIRGKYFEADVSDLLEFTEFVLSSTPWIDGERLGVMGGSYGGILTAWLASHNTRFKAAVTERTAANLISYFGTSEIGSQWMQDTLFSTPWQNVRKYWDSSPLKYVPSVSMPVLVIQAHQDCICPSSNALEFFHALKFFRKESKLILFKEEDHSLKLTGAPRARIRRLREILGWFDTYLR